MPVLKKLHRHALVFDTHIWLWYFSGDKQFLESFKRAVEKCRDRDALFLSPISVWEIGMLVQKNRIELEVDVMEWINTSLEERGVTLAPISPKIAIESTRLPDTNHGDPADRMLIATAHEQNAVLVTCDKKLFKYGKGNYVSVYNPCF